MMMSMICLLAMAIVLYRAICVTATINIQTFEGHAVQFLGLAFHWALAAAGAVAVVTGQALGGPILLVSIALMILTDRRQS